MAKQFKILLATDYSPAVMNAERYALQFAKQTKSYLSLLHVCPHPSANPSRPVEIAMDRDELWRTEMDRLRQHRDELFRSLGITPGEVMNDCVVREGLAGREIQKEATTIDADFVIVGTHGVTGFREVFFGTHTWNVMKKCPVPLLAIPSEALFRGIKHIVFAAEYRQGELPVINYLTRLAADFNADLSVLHITNYVLSKELEKALFEQFRNEVKLANTYPKLNMRLARHDDIVTGLNEYCEHVKADVLAMSPEKTILFEKIFNPASSVTRRMSIHTHTPLLSIPDFYKSEHSAFWKMFDAGNFVGEEF